MKVKPSDLEVDGEGNEFVLKRGEGAKRVFTDEEGNRYVKRSVTSRVLATVVGVVMLGYATIMITQALELPLHLQYVGAAAWTGSVPSAGVFFGAFAAAIGLGVLWVSYTGREGVYLTRSGAILDDVPGENEQAASRWEFGPSE